ncbi:MAG: glycine-rich protein [Terrimicrobiaceae bacterium]
MKFFSCIILLIYSNFSFSQGGCIGGTVTTLSPTVNYGNNTTLTLNVPTGSFQWQYSSDNSNWQNVSGGSVSNINNTATSTTASFSYTGASQTFEVPTGVTSITADGLGAAGGSGYSVYNFLGGNGGKLIADLSTTPGEILNIYVGGKGSNGGSNGVFPGGDSKGGYNGGGDGGLGAGGGGGATDIRRGATDLTNRIFIVGGGGGAGIQRRESEPGGSGGAGGGLVAQDGFRSNYGGGMLGGGGGTQSQGGTSGAPNNLNPGVLGIGGIGDGNGTNTYRSGGGGGGGFFGGGGGHDGNDRGYSTSGGGGGGGSSYSSGTIKTNTQGYSSATGDGSLVLSYTIPASVTSSYTTSLTSPTYFRAVVTDGACVAYSTSSFISVNPNLIITSPIATLTSCLGTASSNTTFGVT